MHSMGTNKVSDKRTGKKVERKTETLWVNEPKCVFVYMECMEDIGERSAKIFKCLLLCITYVWRLIAEIKKAKKYRSG